MTNIDSLFKYEIVISFSHFPQRTIKPVAIGAFDDNGINYGLNVCL